MALKTFSVSEKVYKDFSNFCKSQGLNMSKQIEMFMRYVVEEEPKAKREYLKKLDKIRQGKFVKVGSIAERYKL